MTRTCRTLLQREFGPEHEVRTVRDMGWLGKKNGELLELMSRHGFEALITIDKNLYQQQNLLRLQARVLLLRVFNNRLATLRALMPQLLDRLREPLPSGLVEIRADN